MQPKFNRIYLFILLSITIFFFSCDDFDRKPAKEIAFTIITTDKFNSYKFSELIINTALPFLADTLNEGTILIPKINVILYNYNKLSVKPIIESTFTDKAQGFFGSKNKKSFKKTTNKIREFLRQYEIKELSQLNKYYFESSNMDSFGSYLNQFKNDPKFFYIISDSLKSFKNFGNDIKIVNSIDSLRSAIIQKSYINNKFELADNYVIVINPLNSSTSEPQNADSALLEFNNWKNQSKRQRSEIDSALQSLEQKYPTDYRFTLERLKFKNNDGEIKSDTTDEFLLLLAIDKAIKEGKSRELLELITGLKLSDSKKKKITDALKQDHFAQPNTTRKIPATFNLLIQFKSLPIKSKLELIANRSYQDRKREFIEITLEDFESPEVIVTIGVDDNFNTGKKKIRDYLLNELQYEANTQFEKVDPKYNEKGKITEIKVFPSKPI